MDQEPLFPNRPAKRSDDFRGLLGKNIFPTECCLLENDGHLLVIKDMKEGAKLSDGQRRMFRVITSYSNSEASPGNITVVCVWGLGKGTPRSIIVLDYTGSESGATLSYNEWLAWVRNWWRQHRVGR